MFDTLPTIRPSTPLLDQIASPKDLRQLHEDSLRPLAEELRAFLLYTVGQTGGHFSAGLGVIELTIALHYLLDTPNDHLIWDVGHQSYPHKILTGRREAMASIRQKAGIAAFTSREESEYDAFGVGHSSTSISAALGMAIADKLNSESHHSVAVIGDGAMTAGMAFEALNHAVHTQAKMLIILNDNSMSISANEGGLASYLAKQLQGTQLGNKYNPSETEPPVTTPATIFEDLGLNYLGPCDGHDFDRLLNKLRRALKKKGPTLLHVKTEKGHGYSPAVDNPVAYHALTKIEAKQPDCDKSTSAHAAPRQAVFASVSKYQDVFGTWLCEVAEKNHKVVGITPAMREGSGMLEFSKRFPERFFDVAIAEQHAVTFAAGLSCQNYKPVVAIYSTFLQRAYDQLIHDVAIQNLDVTFAIDRAGIVGEDGATHSGSFDLSFLRCIPNIILACPSSAAECHALLDIALIHAGPAAVRYPRGRSSHLPEQAPPSEVGKGVVLRQGLKACLLNFGALLNQAYPVAEQNNYGLVDMRWVKPLDTELLRSLCDQYDLLVSIEDNARTGGAGSAVLEYLSDLHIKTPVLRLGISDSFVAQGKRNEILKDCGLDSESISRKINEQLSKQA